MRSCKAVFPGILLVLVSCFSLVSQVQAQDVVSPRLSQAMTAPDFPWLADDGSFTVWVYFQDKGLTGAELENALDRAERDLNEKTAWRRGKMRGKGQPLVGEGDLDLHQPYLAAVKATGATLRRESRWLNAASFQATRDQITQMSQTSCVTRIDLVAKFKRPEMTAEPAEDFPDKNPSSKWSINYGGNLAAMEQFNVPAVHEMGITGQGVIIGLLDSGFRTTHDALENIPVLATYDFVNDDENVDNEGNDPTNSNDHGTKTMSTAMGNMPGSLVAPAFGASAILAKTEDVSQEVPIEEDQWVAGLEWVESLGADIVSSSLGYNDWYTWEDMDGVTAVTSLAGDLAVDRGLVVINSAGNERGNSWGHIIAPADGFNVIAVGAVTSSGDYSSFSSPGPSFDGRIKPDVAALGSSNYVATPTDDQGYTTASGTSFSCPLTSGVAALILSRAPQLTPYQVRDALRETASMAQAPNNDFGWGLIDAHAAVTFFGPNFTHTPLGDTEDTTGPYGLGLTIIDREGLDETSTKVWYRADGGPWLETPIWPTGGGPTSYFADIPGQPNGTVVDYYLEASSITGIQTRLPGQAPTQFFSFRVGQDVTPPVLSHTPLRNQVTAQWPPLLICQASDNLAVAKVELFYALNTFPEAGPYPLNTSGDGHYTLEFPLPVENIAIGDVFSYRLVASDAAAVPNPTVSGPHTFEVVDSKGVVLVLEDAPSGIPDDKFDFSQKGAPQLAPTAGKSSAGSFSNWLVDANYLVDVIPAAGVSMSQLMGYDAVVLSSGSNTSPIADATLRGTLQDWMAAGEKLLIEGGEVGYDAEANPGYPDFAAQVLHAVDWDSDNAGRLLAASTQTQHPLLNLPHSLPIQIDVNYSGYGDQDAMEPAADAYVVMVPQNHQADGGIIVYDNNPAPQSAQMVYLAFNIEAIDAQVGRQLAENAMEYLLAPESPPTASLSGQVNLAGESDHSGVTVTLSNGMSVVTGVDGAYSFADLYAGMYSVVAVKDGWAADRQDVDLAENQHLNDINLVLSPILMTSYIRYPGITIPDGTPSGVTSTIEVPQSEAGTISEVNVDVYIQHEWIGDLTVILTSPAGTSVVLHNRSGAQDDNILGNWPGTRPVDGPGSLDDFIGENNGGIWTLFLSDSVGSDEGSLSMWGLNFSLPAPLVPAEDESLPRVTRLLGNVPNPFNPRTEISFDLARAGKVRLDIFDVRGRRVVMLADEGFEAGRHQLMWNGQDSQGRPVSSGTYLYRLRSDHVEQMHKMLLVR